MVDREDSAPLPPADVQRPTPPPTEEELAKIEAWPHLASDVPRLIADLRAEREENERLRRLLDEAGRRWGFKWNK